MDLGVRFRASHKLSTVLRSTECAQQGKRDLVNAVVSVPATLGIVSTIARDLSIWFANLKQFPVFRCFYKS